MVKTLSSHSIRMTSLTIPLIKMVQVTITLITVLAALLQLKQSISAYSVMTATAHCQDGHSMMQTVNTPIEAGH